MEIITLSQLVADLKKTFPELHQTIEELNEFNDASDAFKQNEHAQLVFSYVFNPFLLQFLHMEQDTALGKRLFDFLEIMAHSPDMQVIHVLVIVVLKTLTQEQSIIAQKYMGPKTAQRNLCMWDKDELERRFTTKRKDANARDPKRTWATCWGNISEQQIAELEHQLAFTFDPTTRSFLQAIGNLEYAYQYAAYCDYGLQKHTICTLQIIPQCILSVVNNSTVGVPIMHFTDTDIYYNLNADGYITVTDGNKGYEHTGSVLASYASLAHLVEEMITHAHFLNTFDEQPLLEPSIHREDVALLKLNFSLFSENFEDIGNEYHLETYVRLFPEFNDFIQKAYTYNDYNYTHYKAEPFILLYIFNPFLKHFLANTNCTFIGIRLRYFLEKLAEQNDRDTITFLQEGIFSRLKKEELHCAHHHMGPLTKEVTKLF